VKRRYLCGIGLALLFSTALTCWAGEKTLDNGLRVTAVRSAFGDVCGVHLGIAIGPERVPAKKAGLRAVTQQVLLRRLLDAIRERPELARLRDEALVGGGLQVEMQADYVEFSASVTSGELARLLGVLAPGVFSAEWAEEDVVTAKESLAEAGGNAMEDVSAADKLHSLFQRALWGDCPWTQPMWGTEETREQITLADVRGFYRTFYVPGISSLCIVSPYSEAEVFDMARAAFGAFEAKQVSEVEAVQSRVTQSQVETDISPALENAMLLVGVPLPPVGSDGFARAMVIYGALSGPEGLLSADKSIATGLTLADRIGVGQMNPIEVMPITLSSHPSLAVLAKAVPTAVESTREGILRHLLGFSDRLLTDEELQRAKLRAINLNALAMDQPESLASITNRVAMVGVENPYGGDFSARVMAVTAEDLRAFARQQFTRHAIALLLPEA